MRIITKSYTKHARRITARAASVKCEVLIAVNGGRESATEAQRLREKITEEGRE